MKRVVEEEELQPLVGVVDQELLERVGLQPLKAEDVEDRDEPVLAICHAAGMHARVAVRVARIKQKEHAADGAGGMPSRNTARET